MTTSQVLDATYVLPLRAEFPKSEMTDYLEQIATLLEVIVVDASSEQVRAAHRTLWPATVRQVPVDPDLSYVNGKVNGVLTGLRHASHNRIIIADDDVRYGEDGLRRVVEELARADAIVPQNYFDPLPWHARWDTARSLLNRAGAWDYPGTLGVRRDALADGYDGNVLFENLELLRTVAAAGGRVLYLPDLYVRRISCDAEHFWAQRVRQAYDSFAQPPRLLAELAILPLTATAFRRGGWRGALIVAAAVGTAELGRRRAGGAAFFPPVTSLFAPVWLGERGVCSWLALGARLRGGARYHGRRVRRAATPLRVLRRRWESQRTAATVRA